MTLMTHMALRQDIREQQQYLRAQNARLTDELKPVPEPWPAIYKTGKARALAVYRSKQFLVVVFQEGLATRITVNRTMIDGSGNWLEGISWDELQQIKNELFPDRDAIEIYPRKGDEVNVSNMRHLWILDDVIPLDKSLPFAWRTRK